MEFVRHSVLHNFVFLNSTSFTLKSCVGVSTLIISSFPDEATEESLCHGHLALKIQKSSQLVDIFMF